MSAVDTEPNLLLERYWREPDARSASASELRSAVLNKPPMWALTAGRCLPILRTLANPGRWAERVEEFEAHAARLIHRCHQVDQLGDQDTPPEAVFGVLAEDIDDLRIDQFDPDVLHKARIGKLGRAAAAEAFLGVLGWDDLPQSAAEELRAAIDELKTRTSRCQATALFDTPTGLGLALGVTVSGTGNDSVIGFSDADAIMEQQADAVLRAAYDGSGAKWGLEWEVKFGGSSLGLALWIAARVDRGLLDADPLLASTGRIDPSGSVLGVDAITAKVQAAIAGGFRRVIVPADNEDEARKALGDSTDVTIVGVERVEDLPRLLRQLTGAVSVDVDGAARYVRKLLPLYGLDLIDERSVNNGRRMAVADAASRAQIDLFHGRRGTVKASGQESARQAADRLIDEHLPTSRIQSRSAISRLVASEARRVKLTEKLEREGADDVALTSEHELARYRLSDGPSQAVIVFYKSGKVVVNSGQAPAHDTATKLLDSVLEGLGGVDQPASTTIGLVTTGADSDPITAHIGTDEAGKGDYFGPLVCAACYLDGEVAQLLSSLGVRDSKKLSDKTIRRLAGEIRTALPGRFVVVTIQPARYNSLYGELRREGKNLNSMVAWGHARGIKDLVIEHRIDAEYVVIDKFADERYMRDLLARDSRTRELRLDQRTKAESDIAVAAASILARDTFVLWLEDRSAKLGMTLPKGAGEPVIAAARSLVAQRGKEALGEVAKLAFKTTQRVMESGP